MQKPARRRTTSPCRGPAVGAYHVVCREARLAWSGPQGKSGGPHTWRPHKTFAGQAPGRPWDPGSPLGQDGQRALGFRCISQLGLGVSAPRGRRGEQRPRGHPGSIPCRFYFLSLVVSLAQGSFCLWVTLGTNITSSGSLP